MSAAGGTGTINVNTERECQWTAQPEVAWLSIPAGASGQGGGAIQFTAASNADPVTRSGAIVVNGQRAQVTQAAAECAFSLAELSASFPQSGGNGRADVRASSSLCTWTAASDADWITITSGATGRGSAPVTFTVAPTTGPPRTGTLKIAGLAFSVTQSEGCSYTIAPGSYAAGAAGGSVPVMVTGGAGCPWTASSSAEWVTLSATSGTGNGSVVVTVAPTAGPSRTATLTIAGQPFTVIQSPGCSFGVSPLNHTIDAAGGTRAVNVTAAAGCEWTASSNVGWMTLTSPSRGSGGGTVTFAIEATNGPSRTGTLVVAGQTVTVVQAQGCTFAISPDRQAVPAGGGSGTVAVTAGAGCTWTAASNQSWISITSGASGSGNGSVNFSVAANNGPARTGTLTIAGKAFTVTQGQGCTFALSSGSGSAPAQGGTGSFEVRTAEGCGWSASSDASWLTITAGATGTGPATVRYTAASNAGPERKATITAAGQTFILTQSGGCSYDISPSSQNVASVGGNISVTVTSGAGCQWSATSNAPTWISVASGGSGSGNGTVQLAIAANSEAPRSGTVTIASRTFTVQQDGGCTFALSPNSTTVPASGGSGSFTVATGASCPWTAMPSDGWITVTSGGGTGPGTVQFAVAPNGGPPRSGAITVAGQTFQVQQETGCSAAVAPDTVGVPAGGGTREVGVTIDHSCSWTASAAAAWIVIRSGAGGTGNGTVQFDVQPNAGPARTGTLTVASRTVTVIQDAGCTFSIAPTTQPVAVGGGTGTVAVTASEGCAWGATSNAPWITVTAGASGTGSGAVQFAVEPNTTGAARTGTITIAGQTFTIEQAGAL